MLLKDYKGMTSVVSVYSSSWQAYFSQVASSALRFFLGQDGMKNKVNEESDSEDDGETARDVLLR